MRASRLAASGCALLAAAHLHADVFWRIPAKPDAVLAELGGPRLYATDVRVNGAPGTLACYAVGAPCAQVSSRLAGLIGLRPPRAGSVMLTSSDKGNVTRYLVLPSPAGDGACLTLVLRQPAGGAARARQKPASWPDDVPALAAEPIFTATCLATRTTLVTAESAAAPEAAVREAADALKRAGWTEAPPSSPVFRLFTSNRKVCLLYASRSEPSERTVISLLQREGATP